MKPQVIINNVDQSFFLKNGLDTAEVVTMLKDLPLPRNVRTVVLDGDTTGEQKGEHTTRHPMIYALNTEERKLPVFISSKGRKTRAWCSMGTGRETNMKQLNVSLRPKKLIKSMA